MTAFVGLTGGIASGKSAVGRLFRDLGASVVDADEVTAGVLAHNGDTCVFTRDHLFASPSIATIAVMGRSANGWLVWKTSLGQTLDGAKRQPESLAGA